MEPGLSSKFVTYLCNQVLLRRGGFPSSLKTVSVSGNEVKYDEVDLFPFKIDKDTVYQDANAVYEQGIKLIRFLAVNGVVGYIFSIDELYLDKNNNIVFGSIDSTSISPCLEINLTNMRTINTNKNPSYASLIVLCKKINPKFAPFTVSYLPINIYPTETFQTVTFPDVIPFFLTERLYQGNGQYFLEAFNVYLRLLHKDNPIQTDMLPFLAKLLVAKVRQYPIGNEVNMILGIQKSISNKQSPNEQNNIPNEQNNIANEQSGIIARFELRALNALGWSVITCDNIFDIEGSSSDILRALTSLPTGVDFRNYQDYQTIKSLLSSLATEETLDKQLDRGSLSEDNIKLLLQKSDGNITADDIKEVVADRSMLSNVLTYINEHRYKLGVTGILGAFIFMPSSMLEYQGQIARTIEVALLTLPSLAVGYYTPSDKELMRGQEWPKLPSNFSYRNYIWDFIVAMPGMFVDVPKLMYNDLTQAVSELYQQSSN